MIRLYKGRSYVEVEWTAGPIPIDTPWLPPVAFEDSGDASTPLGTEGAARPLPNLWGKEVIVRYASGLRSGGRWYTDSNGKEMVPRNLDKRGPSYPHPYKLSEPVAGNYYPVSAMQSLDDGTHELAVLTDVTQGGSSLQDGALEFMVHRRLQADDNRGVQEPLNETMCGCNDIGAKPGAMGAHGHEGDGGCECAGLTVRGRHWLVFDEIDEAHKARREISEELNFPPLLAFHPAAAQPPIATAAAATTAAAAAAAAFSAVSQALPPNLKLVTLTNNYAALHGGRYSVGARGTQCECNVSAMCVQCACNVRAVPVQCACSVRATCVRAVCVQCACSAATRLPTRAGCCCGSRTSTKWASTRTSPSPRRSTCKTSSARRACASRLRSRPRSVPTGCSRRQTRPSTSGRRAPPTRRHRRPTRSRSSSACRLSSPS